MKISGNTILITGGGSGIGEALAHRLHDCGNTVIVAGRRRDRLEKAIDGRSDMHALVGDVATAPSAEALAKKALAQHPRLNVLINNAGIMRFEPLDKNRKLDDAEETITTNFLGPIRLTNALVEHLVNQPDATIINMTSGLAFVPLTSTPTYNATKAAMHSYTLSLREALRGRVEVIEVVPPAVQTELTPGQEMKKSYLPLADFADEAMILLAAQPTPSEILVQRARFLRNAEKEGRFDEILDTLNGS